MDNDFQDVEFTKEGMVIRQYFEDNVTLKGIHYLNNDNRLHREGEPAVISYHRNGKPYYEYYYRDGVVHNDMPRAAIIRYDEHGIINARWYYEEGELKQFTIPGVFTKINSR